MTKPFIDKVVEELNLNVIGECSHQFKKDNVPYGDTMIYLLSESHLSIHTFVDEEKVTIDLFVCSLGVENEKIKIIIKDYFVINAFSIDAYYLRAGISFAVTFLMSLNPVFFFVVLVLMIENDYIMFHLHSY